MHWWKCDETSGTEAADSGPTASGNGLTERPLTLVNGASFASGGRDGYAIDFDGSNDRATTADDVIADGLSAYTISMWFKPTGINPSAWQGLGGLMVSNKGALVLVTDNDYQTYHTGSDNSVDVVVSLVGSVTISDDTWSLWTQTWDGSTVTSYLDGASKWTLSDSTIISGPYEVDVGSYLAVYLFNGFLDDVRLYDVALSAGEVGDIWNSGSGDLP
jgi:hypothetical protein